MIYTTRYDNYTYLAIGQSDFLFKLLSYTYTDLSLLDSIYYISGETKHMAICRVGNFSSSTFTHLFVCMYDPQLIFEHPSSRSLEPLWSLSHSGSDSQGVVTQEFVITPIKLFRLRANN